jgi:hypothetical protein
MVHMTRLPPNPKRFIDAMVEEKNIVKLRFVIETSIMTCVYSKHVKALLHAAWAHYFDIWFSYNGQPRKAAPSSSRST